MTATEIHFNELFNILRYPSGETHVYLRMPLNALDLSWPCAIIAPDVRTFSDLAHVVSADAILKWQHKTVRWFIPFFPFARDDRRQNDDHGFELEIALRMIRDLDVTILDPHSDVVGMLPHIKQEYVVSEWAQLWNARDSELPVLVVPDAGAIKKVTPFMTGYFPHEIICAKTRDPKTGALHGFKITQGAELVGGRRLMIVDDICDAGGTFLGLADLLRLQSPKPKSIGLAVTHGLFTKGIEKLCSVFDEIYTTGAVNDARIQSIPHNQIWESRTR